MDGLNKPIAPLRCPCSCQHFHNLIYLTEFWHIWHASKETENKWNWTLTSSPASSMSSSSWSSRCPRAETQESYRRRPWLLSPLFSCSTLLLPQVGFLCRLLEPLLISLSATISALCWRRSWRGEGREERREGARAKESASLWQGRRERLLLEVIVSRFLIHGDAWGECPFEIVFFSAFSVVRWANSGMVEWLLATGYWSPCIRRSPTVAVKERAGGEGAVVWPAWHLPKEQPGGPQVSQPAPAPAPLRFSGDKGGGACIWNGGRQKRVDVSFEGRFSRMSWSGMWGRPVRTGCELMRRFPWQI